ncbi:hypothetical protein [Micromonospora sp. NPDC092111]|uniref:hypothetical protein n=1 Tax=Micromonospora sp. NPDC092111 TaxID=3364289 RepID=UPI00380C1E35
MPPWLTPARTRADVTNRAEGASDTFVWGYAIRREWPDGAHDLFGFTPRADVALRRLDRDRGYWRTGPVRPTAVYLVAVNAADVAAHPVRGCRRSSCPDAPQRGQR